MPSWNIKNLQKHYQKHPRGKSKSCWMDILKKSNAPVTIGEYENQSSIAYMNSWLEYECEAVDQEAWDRNNIPYHPRRPHNVDPRLIVTIVSPDRNWFVTCLHEHFDRAEHVIGSSRRSLTELSVEYLKLLERRNKGGRVKDIQASLKDPSLHQLLKGYIDALNK